LYSNKVYRKKHILNQLIENMRGKKGYEFAVKDFARNLPSYFPPSVVQVKILEKFNLKPSKACISLWRKDIKLTDECVGGIDGLAPKLRDLPILEQMSMIKAEVKRAEELLESLKGQIRSTTYSVRRMRTRYAQLRYKNMEDSL